MSSAQYPKVTQESVNDVSSLLIETLSNPEYLRGAPYSALMLNTIQKQADALRAALLADKISQVAEEVDEEEMAESDEKLTEDIKNQFADLAEGLETRSEEYRDKFNILVRIEKVIRGVEKLAIRGSSDSVKMSATTKLMDFQQQELDILNQLLNVEKAQKIESLTRRFFTEVKSHPDFKKVTDRYLDMLQNLD